MSRLVWLGIGVGIGVYGTRRVQRVGQQVTASGIGRLAVDAHGRVTGFVGAVRVGMAERDAELRAVEQPGARPAPQVADPALPAVQPASLVGVGRAVGGTARALWVGYQAAAAERSSRSSETPGGGWSTPTESETPGASWGLPTESGTPSGGWSLPTEAETPSGGWGTPTPLADRVP